MILTCACSKGKAMLKHNLSSIKELTSLKNMVQVLSNLDENLESYIGLNIL